MAKKWNIKRYRDEARRLRDQLAYREQYITTVENESRNHRDRKNIYRGKLQQLLKDAGQYDNLSSKYIASLIGELI